MEDLNNPENWNVRMIQKGEDVEDILYSPYEHFSMIFDDLEGYYYHKDFNSEEQNNHEHRSSFFYPAHNYSISVRDYFSISVSLENYIKMLKGIKEFPVGFSREPRIEYIKKDIFVHSYPNIPQEIIDYCRNLSFQEINEKYYFVLMNGDNEDYNWYTTLYKEELSSKEIENGYIQTEGNIKCKIIPISEIVSFVKKHPNYEFNKENLDIVEEELKEQIINELGL